MKINRFTKHINESISVEAFLNPKKIEELFSDLYDDGYYLDEVLKCWFNPKTSKFSTMTADTFPAIHIALRKDKAPKDYLKIDELSKLLRGSEQTLEVISHRLGSEYEFLVEYTFSEINVLIYEKNYKNNYQEIADNTVRKLNSYIKSNLKGLKTYDANATYLKDSTGAYIIVTPTNDFIHKVVLDFFLKEKSPLIDNNNTFSQLHSSRNKLTITLNSEKAN